MTELIMQSWLFEVGTIIDNNLRKSGKRELIFFPLLFVILSLATIITQTWNLAQLSGKTQNSF